LASPPVYQDKTLDLLPHHRGRMGGRKHKSQKRKEKKGVATFFFLEKTLKKRKKGKRNEFTPKRGKSGKEGEITLLQYPERGGDSSAGSIGRKEKNVKKKKKLWLLMA